MFSALLLFSIFINDFGQELNATNKHVYADDAVIYTVAHKKLAFKVQVAKILNKSLIGIFFLNFTEKGAFQLKPERQESVTMFFSLCVQL